MKTEAINTGSTVLCDSCNEDYTTSDESGGIVFGSYAYCPKCSPQLIKDAEKYNETNHIKARCPEDKSFGDFVRDYRGGDGIITISSMEPGDSIDDFLGILEGKKEPK